MKTDFVIIGGGMVGLSIANQLIERGMSVIMHDLLEQIQQRDEEDMNRKISPLKPANDSLVIDTSNLSIKEVEEKVMENFKRL